MSDKTKGGVTIKVINGKKYYYYQWYENGKKRSKTISEREYLEYKSNALYNNDEIKKVYDNNINILHGDFLRETISIVKDYNKRDCYKDIVDYINYPTNGKVLILYGLRRTGKTSLIYQTISNLSPDDFNKTAYILIRDNSTLGDLNITLDDLYKKGYKYIFIDEITLLKDFIDGAAFLADVYANVMKIVLSGTDSLGFLISSMNQLYDRYIMIHTSYIPFKEFNNVLNINDIDKYIEYGGTMIKEGYNYHDKIAPIFYDENTTLNYINTSIVHNILHSISCYKNGYNYNRLKDINDEIGLAGIINRLIQDMNHSFVSSIINKSFKSNDYGSLKDLMRKNKISDNLRTYLDKNVDEELLYKDLKNRLDIIDNVFVDETVLSELENYLYKLEVISYVDVYDMDNNIKRNRIVFTQPGLRYALAKSLIESLLNDISIINLSQSDIDLLFDTLLQDVKGRMLEDIVLLETSFNKECISFKAEFQFGEIDMVIYNRKTNSCKIYEIKHAKEINSNQYRHLINEEYNKKITNKYGNIDERIVLYRGDNKMVDNISYINVEEYLLKKN